jgi:uncharacterized lipoprotein YehR (DUF1307 family)
MGSMLLVEAALTRNDIISYRPNQLKDFFGNNIKATYLVQDKKLLRQVLDKEVKLNNINFRNKFDGSRQRIVDFLQEKMS